MELKELREPTDVDALGSRLGDLLELARQEKLSIVLYRFRDRDQVAVEAYPASDFRVQEEGQLDDVIRQLAATVRAAQAQGDETLDGPRLARGLLSLLAATEDLTLFVRFLHPAGSESSCQVEVVDPEPVQVLVNVLAPDAVEAIESAIERLSALDGD